jgi:hypothetical protein
LINQSRAAEFNQFIAQGVNGYAVKTLLLDKAMNSLSSAGMPNANGIGCG